MIAFNIMTTSELPYLKNLIPQLAIMGDEIYVVDSGSNDGTWEWLNDNIKNYPLHLYRRDYDWNEANQRNFILNNTPDKCYVMRIDADELPTIKLRDSLKGILNNSIDRAYLRIFNLHKDLKHIDSIAGFQMRLWWKDNNCKWMDKTHARIDGSFNRECIDIHPTMSLMHFKFLDKDKYDPKDYFANGAYAKEHFNILKNPEHIIELPETVQYDVSDELKRFLNL